VSSGPGWDVECGSFCPLGFIVYVGRGFCEFVLGGPTDGSNAFIILITRTLSPLTQTGEDPPILA